jgi:O-antigen/teichoic acid export membrane protein
LFILLYLARALEILSQFYINFFIVAEKTYQLTAINLLLNLLLLGFNFIIIQRLGIIGAAIAILMVAMIRLSILYIRAKRLVLLSKSYDRNN